MLFLTAASLGVCASATRSALSIVFIVFMILATFVTATLFFLGSPSYFNLLIAVLGYNAGLVNVIAGTLAIRRFAPPFEVNPFEPERRA